MNMEYIVAQLENFLKDSTTFICDYNDEYIRFGDKKTGVFLNLYWKQLFDEFSDLIELKTCFNNKWKIKDFFYSISQTALLQSGNDNLIIWGDKHSSFKDRWVQGFFKDNYAEFLIEMNNPYLEQKGLKSDELLYNFEIEKDFYISFDCVIVRTPHSKHLLFKLFKEFLI